jgi:hypothetical protein
MRSHVIMAVAIAGLALILASEGECQYYHGSRGVHPLLIDSSRVVLKFDDEIMPNDQGTILAAFPRIVGSIPDTNLFPQYVACSLSTGVSYGAFVDSLNHKTGIYLAEPYILFGNGRPAVVGETFTTAFSTTTSRSTIDSVNAAYGVTVEEEMEGTQNIFLMRNTPASGLRLIDLSNLYHGLPNVRWSQPQFNVRIAMMTPYKLYDHYSVNQPHIKKIVGTFNSASVWDFSGIVRPETVAVVDDGVSVHEDLPSSRIIPGRDYYATSSGGIDLDPSPGSRQSHGMACAGLIGASHTTDSVAGLQTSSGLISLNPNSRILPIKVFSDSGRGARLETVAKAINWGWQHGADLFSCSWGADTSNDNYYLNEALDSAYSRGRNGWGCPLIFAAGNSGSDGVQYPANSTVCFAVGAITLADSLWYYSSYGPEVAAVAPSDNICLNGTVWALDQMGGNGYNPNVTLYCNTPVSWNCSTPDDPNYDCQFGGTSAACPLVAGVASLIMAKWPLVSAPGVYNILKHSAVPLPIGVTGPNPRFGYGRVDAFRAVLSISHGDVNNDGVINSIDLSSLVNYLTGGGFTPFPSVLLGDWNCSGAVDSADLAALVSYLTGRGSAPVKPCFAF